MSNTQTEELIEKLQNNVSFMRGSLVYTPTIVNIVQEMSQADAHYHYVRDAVSKVIHAALAEAYTEGHTAGLGKIQEAMLEAVVSTPHLSDLVPNDVNAYVDEVLKGEHNG